MMDRQLYMDLWQELASHKAMVFLVGPRQAGKTTLARMIARGFPNQVYFNWDLVTNKRLLIEKPTFFEQLDRKDKTTPLVIFDEIHKYRKWKNYLKGVYDQFSDGYKFLVLGSGRLDMFQKGGDSLAGRYFQFNLWPFTVAELAGTRRPFAEFIKDPQHVLKEERETQSLWSRLADLSGFPEPYLSGTETVYRRWSRNYHRQLIRQDIRNTTDIKNIDETEVLFSLLPSKVVIALSVESLARDLQVSYKAVRSWLTVFESFFMTFRITPWTRKIARAITKKRKLYLYDYAAIPDPAARFENMVAIELLRAVSNWNDLGWGDFSLHYVRNKEKEEVDFLVAQNAKPLFLVECKFSDEAVSKGLLKFQTMLSIPAVQLVDRPGLYKIRSNGKQQVLVVTASRWLAGLP